MNIDSEGYGVYDENPYDQNFDQLEGELNLVHLFVQDLPQSTSLESLSFARLFLDEKDINLLLHSIWKLPNLRSLDVSGNKIADFVALAANVTATMPASRLRSLDFDDNDLRSLDLSANEWMGFKGTMQDDDGASIKNSILQLLGDAFPELSYLGEDFEQAVKQGIVPSILGLQLDCNRCFGLLQRGATIPHSVWPLVMGKVNKDQFLVTEPSRRATILYQMLQGPGLAQRGSL